MCIRNIISIAMFDKTGYNPELIDKELKLAEGLGFNCIRVLVPYALYEDDPVYLFLLNLKPVH